MGYIQGMSFLAAMLLLNLDSCEAFTALSNLLNNPRYFSGRYSPEMKASHVAAFKSSFKANLPLLWKHFELHDVGHELFLIDWRLSIFCRILPLDLCVRVWDMFLREGETFFVKCSLGILKSLAPSLAKANDLMEIMKILKETMALDTELILANISQIKLAAVVESELGGRFGAGDGRARSSTLGGCAQS